jgi:hypothetical protein
MFVVVCCVLLCVREVVGSWVSAVVSYSKYDISYCDIVLGVGISLIAVVDTYAILVKYLARENDKRKIMTNQLCVLSAVKNCHLLLPVS